MALRTSTPDRRRPPSSFIVRYWTWWTSIWTMMTIELIDIELCRSSERTSRARSPRRGNWRSRYRSREFPRTRFTHPTIGLDLEDTCWTDGLVSIRALPDRPGLKLNLTISNAQNGDAIISEPLHVAEGDAQEDRIAPIVAGV